MTKLSRKFTSSDKMGLYLSQLWSAFTLTDSKEEIKTLFFDLFSHTEYKMFAKRLQIARRLLGGENYEEIRRNLNVTARTISNINNILAARGEGFRKAHPRLSEIEKKKIEREYNRVSKLSKLFKTKPRGQNILPGMAAEGFRYLDRKIAKKIKQQSAGK